jgi:hypothetical protein
MGGELPRLSLDLHRRSDPFFDLIPLVAVSLAVLLAQFAFSQRPSQFRHIEVSNGAFDSPQFL